MNKQPTRRCRASRTAPRSLAHAVAVAAPVAVLGTGQAVATLAPPDERVLERQGKIDHQTAARQASEQGAVEQPAQGSPAGPRGGGSGPSRCPWILRRSSATGRSRPP